MLVLTRRTDESLTIGDSITVTILGIEGDKVKLGIKAPGILPFYGKKSLRPCKRKTFWRKNSQKVWNQILSKN